VKMEEAFPVLHDVLPPLLISRDNRTLRPAPVGGSGKTLDLSTSLAEPGIEKRGLWIMRRREIDLPI